MNKESAQEILKALNKKLEEDTKARDAFVRDNLHLFAEFQVGEEVYNCQTGRVDTVSAHRASMPGSLYAYCEIKTSDNTYDNTSRFAGLHPWVKLEHYEQKTPEYLRKLENLARW